MNNADYWRGRFSILEDSAHREAQKTIQVMEEMYLDAQRSVQKEIESWYARFADNNQISLTDARKWLTAGQLEEFHWTVEQYIKIGEQAGLDAAWLKKLENASARFHISRLESVQMGIQQQLELLYGNQVDSLDALLKKVVGNGYTRTAFEVQKGVGLGWDITALNQKKLETLLSKPWTTDGRTFRDRCWLNKNDLVGSVSKSLPSTFPSICTISGNGVGMMFPPMSRKQSTVTSWNWPKVGQTRMKPLWFVLVRWKAACWESPVFWILPTPRSTVKRRTVP